MEWACHLHLNESDTFPGLLLELLKRPVSFHRDCAGPCGLRAVSYFHTLPPVLCVFPRVRLCRLLSQAPLPASFQLGWANGRHWGRLRVKARRGRVALPPLSPAAAAALLWLQPPLGWSSLWATPSCFLCLFDIRRQCLLLQLIPGLVSIPGLFSKQFYHLCDQFLALHFFPV